MTDRGRVVHVVGPVVDVEFFGESVPPLHGALLIPARDGRRRTFPSVAVFSLRIDTNTCSP